MIKVLAFDTFGTVTDWYTGVTEVLAEVFPDVDAFGTQPTDEELDAAVHAWHVLPAWPEAVDGLRRLKARFTIGSLSNGNVALLTEMAKNADLPWDFVGGADLWRRYKPAPEVYLGIAGLMQVRPDEVLMVATHTSDLDAARACGLQTAYIERPREWGPRDKPVVRNPLDRFHVSGIDALADALGCWHRPQTPADCPDQQRGQ